MLCFNLMGLRGSSVRVIFCVLLSNGANLLWLEQHVIMGRWSLGLASWLSFKHQAHQKPHAHRAKKSIEKKRICTA